MSYQLWEPGQYEGVLKSAAFTESGKTQSPQCELTFAIEGHTKKVFLSFNGGAEQYTLDKLRRLGWNGDVDNPEFAVGQEPVILNCKHDTYNGATKEKWDLAAASKPLTSDRAKLLAQKFKATSGPAVGRPSTPPPAARPAGGPPSRPPSTPPAAALSKVSDRNDAWEAIREATKQDPDEASWFKTIELVEKDTGKKEDDFAAAEWQKVVAQYPPF